MVLVVGEAAAHHLYRMHRLWRGCFVTSIRSHRVLAANRSKVFDAIDGTPLREELNWKVVGSNAVPVERFSLIKPLF